MTDRYNKEDSEYLKKAKEVYDRVESLKHTIKSLEVEIQKEIKSFKVSNPNGNPYEFNQRYYLENRRNLYLLKAYKYDDIVGSFLKFEKLDYFSED